MMTNDQCEQSTTVSLSISYSANLKYHDWSLGRRKCCGVFYRYSSNNDIASCQLRGSWPWKTLGLEITGSGTGWRSKQHFYGGRYEQRLDYKFCVGRREGYNKRGWICIEDEAISWAGLKPEKVEVRANLKLPIPQDEALWWESKCSLGNYKFEWSLKRTHHCGKCPAWLCKWVSESSKVVSGQKSCWRHIWVQI